MDIIKRKGSALNPLSLLHQLRLNKLEVTQSITQPVMKWLLPVFLSQHQIRQGYQELRYVAAFPPSLGLLDFSVFPWVQCEVAHFKPV